MKLIFVGIKPSRAFDKVLRSHGFETTYLKTVPKSVSSRTSIGLVAISIRSHQDMALLARARKHWPTSWIAAVAEEKSLHSAGFQSAMLACQAKDTVWVKSSWEALFWLSVQQMLVQRELKAELRHVRQECDLLQKQFAEMSRGSQKLLEKFEQDVGLAENIQRSLLPKFSPDVPGVSIAVKYIPAAGLGGDYYDIFEFGDRKRFGILLADSKTHGMAAALLSVLLKLRLEEMKDRFPDSHSFVEFLNREILAVHTKDLKSLSLLYGILDRTSLNFHYTTAGPLRPVLWRNGAAITVPAATQPPLGEVNPAIFREHTLKLQPGDLLILHTDGLHAPLTQNGGNPFDKMIALLGEISASPDPIEVQNELMALIDRYRETHPLPDDLTLIHLAIDERALYVAQAK